MLGSHTPGWRIEAKWASGILLVLTLGAAIPLFSFTQLSARQRAVPILEAILRLTLLPPGSDEAVETSTAGAGLEPGERFELLPGTGVTAEPSALEGLSGQEAAARIARELAERTVSLGAAATAESLSASELAAQYQRLIDGAGRQLVRAALLSAMMPSGLDNGSRLANWRLQEQTNPGEPVQPIVGVFVTLPPADLRSLSARQIGERVVIELADVLVASGLPAARELVSNSNLLARLQSAANGPVRERLQELLLALLLPREELLGERLELARSALRARAANVPVALAVVDSEELAGLDTRQANDLVLRRLAERAYEGGSAAVTGALTEAGQVDRAVGASRLIDALSARAHGRYLRLTWLLGLAVAAFAVALALLSRGWGRLANAGAALTLTAAAGALLFTRLAGLFAASEDAPLPEGMAVEGIAVAGVFGQLAQLLAFVAAGLPGDAFALIVRNHLAVLVAGATMLILSVLLKLGGRFGRRRRFRL
jgi:glycosyltransferase A (GT-A) superfamily protein (DUF2064 family)